ncbi:hypothetical protein GPALN_004583 [Globodera pallida]|nr:hypothetical protein GPALN_004583 [Globodera pallida]
MHDKYLKKNILAKCQRVNYELQLLILQNLLQTIPGSTSNETSLEERERKLKIRENMLVYKQNYLKEKTKLVSSLDRIFKGQLCEEFNKALVELRDKVVAHWTWLYEQHDG